MAHETFIGSILRHGLKSKYLQNIMPFVSNMAKSVTGSGLTDAQKEANAFEANQAQKQMDFQQQMRDSQYQSAVADMKQAGVNPALMYGSGASGNVAPSGAMAASESSGTPDVVGLLGQIQNLSLLRSQARLLNSQANKTDQDVEESKERINQIRENTRNLMANYDLIRANVRKSVADAGLSEVALKYADQEHELGVRLSGLSADKIEQEIKESNVRINKLNAEQKTELQKLVNMRQEYNNLVAQQHLTESQQDQIARLINQIDATTNNLIAQTDLVKQDIAFYSWNHTKEVSFNKGHIDTKGNTITFGSNRSIQNFKNRAKSSIKSRFSEFKKAVKAANDLRF